MNKQTEVKREIICEIYGEKGYWVMEIGKIDYMLNFMVMRRFKFIDGSWKHISSMVDKVV